MRRQKVRNRSAGEFFLGSPRLGYPFDKLRAGSGRGYATAILITMCLKSPPSLRLSRDMQYVMLFRRFILFIVAFLFLQVMATAQVDSNAIDQRVECVDCLTEEDYLMALVNWRSELIHEHQSVIQENELFSALLYNYIIKLYGKPRKDSIDQIIRKYSGLTTLDLEKAANESIRYFDVHGRINRKERRSPELKLVHDSLQLRETFQALREFSTLATYFLVDPKWPFRLRLNSSPLHLELEKYRLRKSDVVADVGGGIGMQAQILARAGISCHVNELWLFHFYLKQEFTELPDSISNKLTLVKGSKKNAKLPLATFDAILIRNTFHHFKLPDEMLASIKLALKPGGRVIVLESFTDRVCSCEDGKDQLESDNCELRQAFQVHVNAFSKAGFKRVREEEVPTGFTLTEWVLE